MSLLLAVQGAAASSDLSPYAQGALKQSLSQRAAALRYAGSGSEWIDLGSAVVASSELPPYAQTLTRRRQSLGKASNASAWYNRDSFFEFQVYGQAYRPVNDVKLKPFEWLDDEFAAAVEPLIYAQNRSGGSKWLDVIRVSRFARGAVWVNPDFTVVASDDLIDYAQTTPKRTTKAVGGSAWINPDVVAAVSNDLSPYAQTRRQTLIGRHKPSNTWLDLGVTVLTTDRPIYGANSYRSLKFSFRPPQGGEAWVNLDPWSNTQCLTPTYSNVACATPAYSNVACATPSYTTQPCATPGYTNVPCGTPTWVIN
jgi:hypothetical protein